MCRIYLYILKRNIGLEKGIRYNTHQVYNYTTLAYTTRCTCMNTCQRYEHSALTQNILQVNAVLHEILGYFAQTLMKISLQPIKINKIEW